MHLVEILLPLRFPDGAPIPRQALDRVRGELTERFGGVTAHLRAPAAGAWKDGGGEVERDDVVIVEVMVPRLDRGWWKGYREGLEERFRQEEVVVRATPSGASSPPPPPRPPPAGPRRGGPTRRAPRAAAGT